MKYNLSKIKRRHAYSPQEAAKLLNVDRKTISRWIKESLQLIDSIKSPKLIMGADLRVFLLAKRKAKRFKLEPNQFYCLGCKKPVYAKKDSRKIKETGRCVGSQNKRQFRISGKCERCDHSISRLFLNSVETS